MATLNQISSIIAHRRNRGFDFAYLQQVKFTVRYWTAELIRRDVERNGMSREYLRRFTTKLIKVDAADTCVIDVGCEILRSVETIPTPVRLKLDEPFKYVGETGGGIISGNLAWAHCELNELPLIAYNKYTPKETRYTYINNYIYVYAFKHNNRFKYVTIEGVFTDLTKVKDLCANSGACFTDDEEFPIGEDMLRSLIQGILTGEFKEVKGEESAEVTIEE